MIKKKLKEFAVGFGASVASTGVSYGVGRLTLLLMDTFSIRYNMLEEPAILVFCTIALLGLTAYAVLGILFYLFGALGSIILAG